MNVTDMYGLMEARRGYESGVEVMGSYKLLDVGAERQTLVLWKSPLYN